MPWSIFSTGGGNAAAATWAQDLLKRLNLPATNWREQFVYNWEKSEGGGGKNNPLNEGPVTGQPTLTTTGQQYGGGAADYKSITAGLQGAVDYLHMPNYAPVLQQLDQGSYTGAAHALWDSPWAGGHYGYGKNWNTSPFPGQTGPIQGAAPGAQATLTSYTQTTTKATAVKAAGLAGGTNILAQIDAFLNPGTTKGGFLSFLTVTHDVKTLALLILGRSLFSAFFLGVTAIGFYMMVRGPASAAVGFLGGTVYEGQRIRQAGVRNEQAAQRISILQQEASTRAAREVRLGGTNP